MILLPLLAVSRSIILFSFIMMTMMMKMMFRSENILFHIVALPGLGRPFATGAALCWHLLAKERVGREKEALRRHTTAETDD